MELHKRKLIAAKILKTSPKNIAFNTEELTSIKEAITKADIRRLINKGVIYVKSKNQQSRGRARIIKEQKVKGRRTGHGSRKGKSTARAGKKEVWMLRIRKQRAFLKYLKENNKIDNKVYREFYRKAKGGFFRNLRHLKIYLNETLKRYEKA